MSTSLTLNESTTLSLVLDGTAETAGCDGLAALEGGTCAIRPGTAAKMPRASLRRAGRNVMQIGSGDERAKRRDCKWPSDMTPWRREGCPPPRDRSEIDRKRVV